MVTTYYVLSRGGQAIFEWKCLFLQLFSTIKVKPVNEMMQRAYLNVILHVKHRKLSFIAILTWFLILGEIQDGDHCWWRHRPPAAAPPIKNKPHLVEYIKGFPLKAKSFRNTANYHDQNFGEGFHPPLPLIPRWGMNLRVRPRVNPVKLIWIICFSHLLYSRGEKTEKELLILWWWWWW